jgi:peptidoglycan/xylan/chitin deacetylase (PgdA/CDA1 family)
MPNHQKNPFQPPRREAIETEYRRLVELAFQDDYERQRGIRSLKVITGDPTLPYVAFTFDDGPHGDKSLELLQILRRLSVPATFFVVGSQVRQFPQVLERMVLEGHEVGNHTFHHYRLPQIPLEEVAPELNTTRDLLRSLFGINTRLVRPPGGEYNSAIQRLIEVNGYANILWSADPADYKIGRTPNDVEALVMRDVTPGGIVLLHDGVPATYAALPRIIARVRQRGLIPVTVSELIERGGGLLRVREMRVSQTCAT